MFANLHRPGTELEPLARRPASLREVTVPHRRPGLRRRHIIRAAVNAGVGGTGAIGQRE